MENQNLKFCKHCGAQIPKDAILCTACGRQVEEISGQANQPNIVINNSNENLNVNNNAPGFPARARNKWVALALCIFLGFFGAHKFYDGKAGMGILYIFTAGIFGIGIIVDIISILCKPNPYYVM